MPTPPNPTSGVCRHRVIVSAIAALLTTATTTSASAQDFGRVLGRLAERTVERSVTSVIDETTRPRDERPATSQRQASARTGVRGGGQGPSATAHAGQRGVNVSATTEVSDIRVRASDGRRMHERLRALLSILHRQERFAALDGFSLRNSVQARSTPDRPFLQGQALTLVTLPITGGSDCPSRDGQPASQCGPGLTLRTNDPLAAVLRDAGDYRGHVQLPMTPLPQQNGFEVYREGDQTVLVRSRPGVPLFIPMSRQSYLEYMGTPGAAAELATLSPAERQETACAATRRTILKRCEDTDLYMATINPAYFDTAKGPASVQLITLAYFERNTDRHQVIRDAVSTLHADDLPLD